MAIILKLEKDFLILNGIDISKLPFSDTKEFSKLLVDKLTTPIINVLTDLATGDDDLGIRTYIQILDEILAKLDLYISCHGDNINPYVTEVQFRLKKLNIDHLEVDTIERINYSYLMATVDINCNQFDKNFKILLMMLKAIING